eukprot:TRINITY_DN5523_c0_g1_i1.p1 TRINITY_DN5523_c0_g1~~TRINITY_DN5523_c0_g1_i1.p1  ORF type:complete len:1765 (-),score=588.41 TRINITY_DN5523_c0_g1_i1:169-5421(-)
MLPTSVYHKQIMIDMLKNGSHNLPELVNTTPHLRHYFLQILNLLIHPRKSIISPEHHSLREHFINDGGLAHCIEFFPQITDSDSANALLNIISTCAFVRNVSEFECLESESKIDNSPNQNVLQLINPIPFVEKLTQMLRSDHTKCLVGENIDSRFLIEKSRPMETVLDLLVRLTVIGIVSSDHINDDNMRQLAGIMSRNPVQAVRKCTLRFLRKSTKTSQNQIISDKRLLKVFLETYLNFDENSTDSFHDTINQLRLGINGICCSNSQQEFAEVVYEPIHQLSNRLRECILQHCEQGDSSLTSFEEHNLGLLSILLSNAGADGASHLPGDFGLVLLEKCLLPPFKMADSVDQVADESKMDIDTPIENNSITSSPWPLLKQNPARSEAFGILDLVCQKAVGVNESPKTVLEMFDRIRVLVDNVKEGISVDWSIVDSAHLFRNDFPFVGLENQGLTCYMNSTIQQLYMITKLREAVLNVDCKVLADEEEHSDLSKLVGRNISIFTTSGKRIGVHVTAITEEGYLNVLFENGQSYDFKPNFADANITGEYVVEPLPAANSTLERQRDTRNLIMELKKTFANLKLTVNSAYDPEAFVRACSCLKLEYDVFQQNDSAEFFDKIVDRIEEGLKGTDALADLQFCFSGKMCSQKKPEGCNHNSERLEPFVRVELPVRDKKSVHDSLSSVVAGERMAGDNKVFCDECNEKKDTLRRTCFGELPNVLCLHLKRFDLDYTTFETVKLNSRCEFPMELNMKQYSKEGLDILDALNGGERTPEIEEILNDPDYAYDLCGMIIHLGVAQGGHYYSIIKDRTNDQWYKFDDDNVTPFLETHIPNHAFGGSTGSSRYQSNKNALMLFYERKNPKPIVIKESNTNEETTEESKEEKTPEQIAEEEEKLRKKQEEELKKKQEAESEELLFETRKAEEFVGEVSKDNVEAIRKALVLDSELHMFLARLLQPGDDISTDGLHGEKYKLLCGMVLDVMLHAREKRGAAKAVSALVSEFTVNKDAVTWFLQKMNNEDPNDDYLSLYFKECRDYHCLDHFSELLVSGINEGVSVGDPVGSEVLRRMVSLVNEVDGYGFDSFYACLQALLAKPLCRMELLKCDLIESLIQILTLKNPLLKNNKQCDEDVVLKTYCVALGAKVSEREHLFIFNSVAGLNEINPKLELALRAVFDKYSSNGIMGQKELISFLRKIASVLSAQMGQRIQMDAHHALKHYAVIQPKVGLVADEFVKLCSDRALQDGEKFRRSLMYLGYNDRFEVKFDQRSPAVVDGEKLQNALETSVDRADIDTRIDEVLSNLLDYDPLMAMSLFDAYGRTNKEMWETISEELYEKFVDELMVSKISWKAVRQLWLAVSYVVYKKVEYGDEEEHVNRIATFFNCTRNSVLTVLQKLAVEDNQYHYHQAQNGLFGRNSKAIYWLTKHMWELTKVSEELKSVLHDDLQNSNMVREFIGSLVEDTESNIQTFEQHSEFITEMCEYFAIQPPVQRAPDFPRSLYVSNCSLDFVNGEYAYVQDYKYFKYPTSSNSSGVMIHRAELEDLSHCWYMTEANDPKAEVGYENDIDLFLNDNPEFQFKIPYVGWTTCDPRDQYTTPPRISDTPPSVYDNYNYNNVRHMNGMYGSPDPYGNDDIYGDDYGYVTGNTGNPSSNNHNNNVNNDGGQDVNFSHFAADGGFDVHDLSSDDSDSDFQSANDGTNDNDNNANDSDIDDDLYGEDDMDLSNTPDNDNDDSTSTDENQPLNPEDTVGDGQQNSAEI